MVRDRILSSKGLVLGVRCWLPRSLCCLLRVADTILSWFLECWISLYLYRISQVGFSSGLWYVSVLPNLSWIFDVISTHFPNLRTFRLIFAYDAQQAAGAILYNREWPNSKVWLCIQRQRQAKNCCSYSTTTAAHHYHAQDMRCYEDGLAGRQKVPYANKVWIFHLWKRFGAPRQDSSLATKTRRNHRLQTNSMRN